MNCRDKVFLTVLILCSSARLAAECSTTPFYYARSQGSNAARQMVGWEELINQCDNDCLYIALSATAEYSQTFRSSNICECLFGTTTPEETVVPVTCPTSCASECEEECQDCFITVSGSCVANRKETDWMAENFGLPTNYSSKISFNPRIKNFVADLGLYAGFDNCWYFRLNAPIVNTRWSLQANETAVSTAAGTAYTAGYFSAQSVPASQLVPTALDFFSGCRVPDLTTGQNPSVVFQPLKYGKWATCKSLNKTAVSDLTAVLGYNFVCNDCGFFGLNLRSAAPTGTKPEAEYLFEPVVGNAHHWTLGVGMNAKYVFWKSKCDESDFSMYLDANVSHLFSSRQTRTFDLCANGANSRYMLAQKLEGASLLQGEPSRGVSIKSNLQFANEFAPVANLLASKVYVNVSVEGEVALKFAYRNACGVNWDLGYNFWGRSHERITPTKCSQDLSLWALKGDAFVYGFETNQGAAPRALGATESNATIYLGTAGTISTESCNNDTNTNIDGATLAFYNGIGLRNKADSQNIKTSIQPVTLDTAAINYASNRGISHKVFTHLNYIWNPCEEYTPFIGVGASAEFGQSCKSNKPDCDEKPNCQVAACTPKTGCNDEVSGTHTTCALSQWAVWLKGGVRFN